MKPTGHPKSAVRYLPYARTQTRTRAARRTGVHGGTQAEIPCKLNLEGGASMPVVFCMYPRARVGKPSDMIKIQHARCEYKRILAHELFASPAAAWSCELEGGV